MLRSACFLLVVAVAAPAATPVAGLAGPVTAAGPTWIQRHLVGSGPARAGAKAALPDPHGGTAVDELAIDAAAEDERRPWRLGVHYFKGTTNNLSDFWGGDVDTIPQDGIRVAAALVLVEELWDLPLNINGELGIMWHNERGAQSDLFQYTLGLDLEWTEFPWNDRLRTRFGVSVGLSYADSIPTAEKLQRGTNSSKHLLGYLDFSLAFNTGDIVRWFSDSGANALDDVWLVASIPHRSGAWGLFGNDNTGQSVKGGSNYLAIGIEYDF